MSREFEFDTINIEDAYQKSRTQFTSKINIVQDERKICPTEETGFIFQEYSGFAPKAFNTPDKRDFIKIHFDPNQKSCNELKDILNQYDDAFEINRPIIFGKFDRLYKFIETNITNKYKNKLIILDNASSHINEKIKTLVNKNNKLLY